MITKTALLRCDPARAFRLLTEHAGEWWPPDRRHTGDPHSTIRIEASGRFYERASDGKEAELGVVRVYDPPHRVVLDWYPGTGPHAPTHVEIALAVEGTHTRVTIEHRAGPASADLYTQRAAVFDRSWTAVLDAWSAAVGA